VGLHEVRSKGPVPQRATTGSQNETKTGTHKNLAESLTGRPTVTRARGGCVCGEGSLAQQRRIHGGVSVRTDTRQQRAAARNVSVASPPPQTYRQTPQHNRVRKGSV